jgi:hypothetical protein
MRKFLLLVSALVVPFGLVYGEDYTFSGKVIDSITKEPLEGVAMSVKQENQCLITDANGAFSLKTSKPALTVEAQFQGYEDFKQQFKAPYAGVVIELDLAAEYTLGEVKVKGNKNAEGGSKQEITIQQVNKSTAHFFSDAIKILQTMPGVVMGNDFSSLMYVQGGQFYETACYLDNTYIINPYLWGGNVSIFNPAFVDKIDFYSAGFPVRYPQALSAVIDVKNIEGDYKKSSGYIDANLTTLEVFAEGPMQKDSSSYVFGFRRTYYDVLAELVYGNKYSGIELPYFYDSQSKFTWKLRNGDKLSLDLLGSYEGMKYDSTNLRDNPDERIFKFNYDDSRVLPSLSYEQVLGENLSMNSTLAFRYDDGTYAYSDETTTSTARTREYDTYFRNRLTYTKGIHTIEQGVYMFRTVIDAHTDVVNTATLPDATYAFTDNNYDYNLLTITAGGVYLQDDAELVKNKLYLNLGGLYEYLDITHDTTFSPRGGVKYMLTDKIALKFNTGLYTQFPVNGDNGPPPIMQNYNIKAEKAIHYVLGYEHELPSDYFLRCDTYIKDYFDRVVADPDPSIDYTNNGKEQAQGVDLFLQKKPNTGKWDGWLAYSYLYAKDYITARSDPAMFGKSALDFLQPVGEWYPFQNQRTNNLAAVVNYEFTKWFKLSATFWYATGTPYTDVTGVISNNGIYAPVYGKYLDDTLPDYSRLDIKFTMPRFSFKRRCFIYDKDVEFYVQIINALNHVNVDGYYYSSDYKQRYVAQMLPFLPMIGVKYKW